MRFQHLPPGTVLTPQQRAQHELDHYLHVYGKAYADPRHPDHHIVTAEVRQLVRAAAGPDADEPL